MRNLLLDDLKLGLVDLFDRRHDHLMSCTTGQVYAPLLRSKLDAIVALPSDLVGGKPLAQKLAEHDSRHDAYGGAIYLMMEAYRRLAPYEPEVAQIAIEVEEMGFDSPLVSGEGRPRADVRHRRLTTELVGMRQASVDAVGGDQPFARER